MIERSRNSKKKAGVSYNNTTKASTGQVILFGLFIIVFLAVIIIGAYMSFKLSIMRYDIAAQAINKGQDGIAAGALAPEIGEGIGNIIRNV
jgi:hypothetical protein